MSQGLIRTQKQVSSDAELPSHRLLLQAGLVRRVSAGIYSLTPLAYRVMRRIQAIAREEMDRIGGQEILLPVAQPASLWRESGRYDTIDSSMARWKDRTGQDMVLAMTHEEAVTDLVRSMVDSYRQLPLMVYQIQTKFRDEARPRGGLVRLREFMMKDGYSFHTTAEDLDRYYRQVMDAYLAFYQHCGVEALVVQSDTGMMGGRKAHEFMVLADGGEDTLIVCQQCDYAANREVAVADKGEPPHSAAALEPVTLHHTPGTPTIEALAQAMGCSAGETLKCVFYTVDGTTVVLACIRGDLTVSDVKLQNLLGMGELRTLSAAEATALGLVVGFASPVGLHLDVPVTVVADDSVVGARNLVTGANRPDYHSGGVNYGRDFTAAVVGDIAEAAAGHRCAQCGGELKAVRGIEAGNIFSLGTKYSEAMNAVFQDENGATHPMLMGCYGIGITRMVACVIEQNRDADGIIWPESVAPFRCHLLTAGKDPAAVEVAEQVYARLGADAVLYDDRELSAGVKFKDADLLGMPLRLTVSSRSLAAGGVEVRNRRTGETRIVAVADLSS
ncbi:MAG: proline--tRNA ligase [Mycobacterium leprae]